LRAINVGGSKPVGMSDLRCLLERLGFDEVRTLLQSGNVVFRGASQTTSSLERTLETEARKLLGLQTEFFVRTAPEWNRIIEKNPFREEAVRDPSHLVLMTLKDPVSADHVRALQAAIKGPEIVKAERSNAYIVYPAGIGRSKLTNALIEKHFGTRGTARNWNTVIKLSDAAAPMLRS
jgi:uncharacterized protein (DUF1697 family)